MNRINLVILLDKLEEIIDNAPEIPLTGRAIVEPDEVLDLIDKIRNSIPEEVKRAEAVSTEKDRLISEGQQKAERMIAQAEEYANKLIRDSEIHRQAQQEAKRIIDDAQKRAAELEKGANEYAQQVLGNLQAALEKTLSVVAKGKEELKTG